MTDKKDTMICKFCGSDNVIKKKQTGYVVMISILLLGLPLPFFKKSYYCFDCEKEWKIEKTPCNMRYKTLGLSCNTSLHLSKLSISNLIDNSFEIPNDFIPQARCTQAKNDSANEETINNIT